MFWLYLAIGVALAAILHFVFRWYETHPENHATFRKVLATGGVLTLILILLRVGLSTVASILSALVVLVPLLERFLPAREGARSGESMTVEEACKVLGVAEKANRAEIQEAYVRLMQRLHPDQGGSDYLASKLNQARDLLLKKR